MATAGATRLRAGRFYGWRIIWVTTAGAFSAAAMAQIFPGAMLPYIESDTGWDRTSITLAVTLGSISAGLVSPLFGRIADRYGPRLISSVGLVITVLAMWLLALSGSVSIALFYVGYITGRSMSQNALGGVVPRTAAINWFRRQRGRALGISQMGIPLGGAALVPLAQFLIHRGATWETVYYIYGGVMLVTLLPLFLTVLRRRPEDMGLLPDGDEAPPPTSTTSMLEGRVDHEQSWTLAEAMRTPTLWLLIGALSTGMIASGGVGFHQFAYFTDEGVAAGVAAAAVSVYSLTGGLANGVWGMAAERLSVRLIGTGTVFVAGLSCLFLLTADTPVEVIAFAVTFGVTLRGLTTIIMVMIAHYYGRDSFGAISGFVTPFQMVALGLGPTLASVIYELSGRSYTNAFLIFAAILFVSALLIALARRPTYAATAGA